MNTLVKNTFSFAVYLASVVGHSCADSSREGQYTFFHAPNAVEAHSTNVQYTASCCCQSPGYTVSTSSVYKVIGKCLLFTDTDT